MQKAKRLYENWEEKANGGENWENLIPIKQIEAVKKINKDSMDKGRWNRDMP